MTTNTLAIITGASRGLGAAIAHQYLEQQIPIITLARNHNEALDQLARDHNTHCTQLVADLSDLNQAQQAAQQLVNHLPADLDNTILINNAGTVQPIERVDDLTHAAAIDSAITLNLSSVMLLSAAVISACKQRDCDLRIVNISSGAGRSPTPGWGVYCATKAALDMYTRVLVQEQTEQNTRVRAVSLAPGVVDTDMQGELRASSEAAFPRRANFIQLHEQGQLGSPKDIAARIINLVAHEDFGRNPIDDIRHHP